jgi:hypothetical protein
VAQGLPNPDRAFVDRRKVRDYLLSFDHGVGRYKAAFFLRLGYSRSRWTELRADLLEMARSVEAQLAEPTRYGQKYVTVGALGGSTGRTAKVTAVWIVRCGEDFPRLVTVVPGGVP